MRRMSSLLRRGEATSLIGPGATIKGSLMVSSLGRPLEGFHTASLMSIRRLQADLSRSSIVAPVTAADRSGHLTCSSPADRFTPGTGRPPRAEAIGLSD